MDNNFLMLLGGFLALKVAFVYFWTPIAWIACGFFCSVIASDKRYSGGWWFVLGILFGPLALVAAAGLPNQAAIRVVAISGSSTPQKIEPGMSLYS